MTPAHAQTDMIPVSQITFVGPGGDVGVFPITTVITNVSVNPGGTEAEFSKKSGAGRWPDQRTPGWDGDLQYSMGFVVKVNGAWFASAPIENWFDRTNATGPIQDQSVTCEKTGGRGQLQCNVFYDQRWNPLQTVRPQPGDTIGVFVVSGDARNDFFLTKERSNIVTIQLPAQGQTSSTDFSGVVIPPPPPPQPPNPNPDLTPDIQELQAQIRALLNFEAAVIKRFEAVEGRVFALEGRKFPVGCRASVFAIGVSCSLTN